RGIGTPPFANYRENLGEVGSTLPVQTDAPSHSKGDPMKVDLAGRVALITGSGQGIGEAMAYAFSENGATIAVNDINPGGVKTVQEIEKRGGKAKFYHGDVGDVDRVNAMVAEV